MMYFSTPAADRRPSLLARLTSLAMQITPPAAPGARPTNVTLLDAPSSVDVSTALHINALGTPAWVIR